MKICLHCSPEMKPYCLPSRLSHSYKDIVPAVHYCVQLYTCHSGIKAFTYK